MISPVENFGIAAWYPVLCKRLRNFGGTSEISEDDERRPAQASTHRISYPAVLKGFSSRIPFASRAGPVLAMKRREELFPDPKELNLDRFLDADRGTG
jgi:hypothetical protein